MSDKSLIWPEERGTLGDVGGLGIVGVVWRNKVTACLWKLCEGYRRPCHPSPPDLNAHV